MTVSQPAVSEWKATVVQACSITVCRLYRQRKPAGRKTQRETAMKTKHIIVTVNSNHDGKTETPLRVNALKGLKEGTNTLKTRETSRVSHRYQALHLMCVCHMQGELRELRRQTQTLLDEMIHKTLRCSQWREMRSSITPDYTRTDAHTVQVGRSGIS